MRGLERVRVEERDQTAFERMEVALAASFQSGVVAWAFRLYLMLLSSAASPDHGGH